MHIGLLSQWYAPETEARVTLLSRELAKRGHEVTVLTGFPNYPHGKLFPGYKLRVWKREELESVNVVRLFLYPDHSRNPIKRSLNYFSFAASATLLGPFMFSKLDLLWAYHPPLTVGIPAWWIAFLRRVPFVYEIQDIWPETVIATGMMDVGLGVNLLTRLSHFVYKRASAITVISPGFKRNLIQKGVPADKVYVVSNWADEDVFRPVKRDLALGEQYKLTNSFNIMFSGNMGPAQGLENLIEVAALLIDLPDVQFTMIGDGLSVENLQALANAKGLSNIQFIGRQPLDQIPHFHAWADGLLVHLSNDPLFHITIPSKTLAYLASGRPILCAVSGDGATLVGEAKAGIVCAPSNPQALADAVRALHAMQREERETLGQNGRQHFLDHYSRRVLVDKYESIFNDMVRLHG